MHNLRTIDFEATAVECDLPLTATAWDATNDSVICAFGPTIARPVIELKRKVKIDSPLEKGGTLITSSFEFITSWDAPSPLPELDCDEILLLHYFADTSTICLVLAGGDLVLVREEPEDGQERIEIVGSVDVGIAAAAWAPDAELLAIVTNSDNLVLMSRDLEPVTETIISADDLQASKHVSVGWGKKETQFQGKRAKAMRDPTMPEQVDEGALSQCEDGRVNISWRGDGAYFAVNAVVKGHRRVIRVYSREGLLYSVSEPVDGLESALSWRPLGNLIASVRRSIQGENSKLDIVFFERNGLRHGEFSLRVKPDHISILAKRVVLAWNIDSSVLAVSYDGHVQYWTMGNYHYYLKQEVRVSNNAESSDTKVIWHPEKALRSCASDLQSVVDLEYLSHVKRGSTIQQLDYGIVAVIDGTSLKLTPLRHAGVPPPMSFCETEARSNIIDVAISKNGQKLVILLSSGIELWQWKMRESTRGNSSILRHSTVITKREFSWHQLGIDVPQSLRCSQVIFNGDDDIFILAPAQLKSQAQFFHVSLYGSGGDVETGATVVEPVTSKQVCLGKTLNLLADNTQDTVWMQNLTEVKAIDSTEGHPLPSISNLGSVLPNTVLFKAHQTSGIGITNGFHQSFHTMSLTRKGTLLVDGLTLARDCTSFVLTDLHLIFTTAQHLLKFVYLSHPENMKAPEDTPEVDERCRSIERGAKIVTVIPSIYAVVLQMPRGNIETIYPRVLVLNGIRLSLRNLEYRSAFVACQNHQVDPNILHDYQPEIFMANVKKFIDDLKKPARVDEFLSKLKEEDVSQTLYKDTLNASTDNAASAVIVSGHKAPLAIQGGSVKINAICDAFIAVLKEKPGKFLQCIITAHVCKRPPDFAAALTQISALRQNSAEEADLAVSHLCFLTDTNRLFDAALGLYDLELTLLVAQNAQRDPREYMPFLQNLQSLPYLRRQYQIDNHLHNHEKALTSLHALEAHEEVESYTVKHNLYTHALDLYKYSPSHLSKLTTLYAEYLASQSQHSAAATLYDSLNLHAEAYPLYALAHQWRECLTCATLVPLSPPQLRTLALTLATNLAEESRDYRSAATIHTDYLSDPVTASKLLTKGSYFPEATRLLSHHNLAPEIPHIIDTGLGEKFSEILELVSDCKSQLAAQVPRIQDLRVKKAEDPLAFYGGDAATTDIDIPDNISLAPTDATTAGGQSLFTRYGGSQGSKFAGTVASNVSRKTSKTKRREERKRARGKKGSVYEEEYLVASVGRLIERVNGVHEEVGRLVSGLMRRGMREQARKVGEVMAEIGGACERARAEVWDVDVKGEQEKIDGGMEVGEEYRPSGADGVFWDSQVGGVKKMEAPVVKVWKGMGWL